MSLATVEDVANRLGRPITDALEQARVQALLDDTSALVLMYCTKGIPTPTPAFVLAVVCTEVLRILNGNPGVSKEVVGDVQVQYADTPSILSPIAKEALKVYRNRIASVQLFNAPPLPPCPDTVVTP